MVAHELKIAQLKSTLSSETKSRYRAPPKVLVPVVEGSAIFHPGRSFGKVPRYLKRMEEVRVEKENLAADKARRATIPEGFRYMSVDERETLLNDLESQRNDAMNKLKGLPLRIETLGQRRTKLELDLKLMNLDKTIEKMHGLKNVLTRVDAGGTVNDFL